MIHPTDAKGKATAVKAEGRYSVIPADVLTLAAIERPSWRCRLAALHETGTPLNAAPGQDAPAAPSAVEQPQAGRGDVDHLQGLYEEHLQAVPEHLRPTLQDALHKINAGVGKKFSEHAEYRQRFEPLEKIEGLTDTPAEDVEHLLSIRTALLAAQEGDQNALGWLQDWWSQIGDTFGFGPDDEGYDEGGDGTDDDEPPPWAQELIQGFQDLQGWRQEFEGQQRSTQAQQQLDRQMSQLAEQHGLDEDAQNRVLQLSLAYNGAEDALTRGLQDYLAITGKGEQGLLAGVERSANNGPVNPGGAPSAGEDDAPKGFDDPRLKAAMMARLKGQTSGAAL